MKKIIFLIVSVLTIFFLSGCVQIEVNQKIKRTSMIDLSIMFKAKSPEILNVVKQNIQISPKIKAKFSQQETSASVTYKFRNFDPYKDELFDDKANLTPGIQSPLMNIESYQFKKEFKFPYYVLTYSINMNNVNGNNGGDLVTGGLRAGYTIRVFGKIIETNGSRIDKHTVKFDIGLYDKKIYYVKFKDFFLITWFCVLFRLG
ncbi:MAG: hypothetical protein PHV30_02845 [Candidatus Margulisbacteria bacterium]|nr:hypothetical protein [Candidatus Margulisiibacteriota bacterium]